MQCAVCDKWTSDDCLCPRPYAPAQEINEVLSEVGILFAGSPPDLSEIRALHYKVRGVLFASHWPDELVKAEGFLNAVRDFLSTFTFTLPLQPLGTRVVLSWIDQQFTPAQSTCLLWGASVYGEPEESTVYQDDEVDHDGSATRVATGDDTLASQFTQLPAITDTTYSRSAIRSTAHSRTLTADTSPHSARPSSRPEAELEIPISFHLHHASALRGPDARDNIPTSRERPALFFDLLDAVSKISLPDTSLEVSNKSVHLQPALTAIVEYESDDEN